jgi:hypothetical protein
MKTYVANINLTLTCNQIKTKKNMSIKITATEPKRVGVPKTVQEKYERLAQKNPAIDKLREAFGLEIIL